MNCKKMYRNILVSLICLTIVYFVAKLKLGSAEERNWGVHFRSPLFSPVATYPVHMDSAKDSPAKHDNKSDCQNIPVPVIDEYKDSWQPVSQRGELFLYSAFLDVDTVRLVGLRTKSVGNLTCQVWYRNNDSVTVTMETTSTALKTASGGPSFKYLTTYAVCDLRRAWSPYAVSVVDGNDTCRQPNNTFSVYGQRSISGPRFNFTVCVPPVRDHYPTLQRFIEWIEMNRLLGAEFFTFYNDSIHSDVARIFQKYEDEGVLEILRWNRPTNDVHYGAQIASMDDCLHRNQKRAKFTAFMDLDEFIIPRKAEDLTWADMFKRLPPACSYSFQSSFFVGNYTRDTKVVLNNVRRQRRIFDHQVRSKIIVKPDEINSFSVHLTYSCKQGQTIHDANTAIGMVHHYRKEKHCCEVWDNTTLKYKIRLGERLARFKLHDKV